MRPKVPEGAPPRRAKAAPLPPPSVDTADGECFSGMLISSSDPPDVVIMGRWDCGEAAGSAGTAECCYQRRGGLKRGSASQALQENIDGSYTCTSPGAAGDVLQLDFRPHSLGGLNVTGRYKGGGDSYALEGCTGLPRLEAKKLYYELRIVRRADAARKRKRGSAGAGADRPEAASAAASHPTDGIECLVCRRSDGDPRKFVLCDGPCQGGAHLSCLGLARVPEHDWLCEPCAAQWRDHSAAAARRRLDEELRCAREEAQGAIEENRRLRGRIAALEAQIAAAEASAWLGPGGQALAVVEENKRLRRERDEQAVRCAGLQRAYEDADAMLMPTEMSRRVLQNVVSEARDALIAAGLPTRNVPVGDADGVPFFYKTTSHAYFDVVPWNPREGRVLGVAEAIRLLAHQAPAPPAHYRGPPQLAVAHAAAFGHHAPAFRHMPMPPPGDLATGFFSPARRAAFLS